MQYHSYYFEAMAYYVLAQEEAKVAGDSGKGMGRAVGLYRATITAFEKAK